VAEIYRGLLGYLNRDFSEDLSVELLIFYAFLNLKKFLKKSKISLGLGLFIGFFSLGLSVIEEAKKNRPQLGMVAPGLEMLACFLLLGFAIVKNARKYADKLKALSEKKSISVQNLFFSFFSVL
jgi:uncharacterized membrane protein